MEGSQSSRSPILRSTEGQSPTQSRIVSQGQSLLAEFSCEGLPGLSVVSLLSEDKESRLPLSLWVAFQ